MFFKKHACALEPAIPAKGGTNDLSRWEAFGGTLKRPAPPAPMKPAAEEQLAQRAPSRL